MAPRARLEIGEIRSLKIDVLSETGWFDDTLMKQTMLDHGGPVASQYDIPWDRENAGGYAALLTVTTLAGEERKILLDTGWNTAWMDEVYDRYGIPRMLERGEIDCLVLSHWHLDHAWGIESTLKHNPAIPIYAPRTWTPRDRALLTEGVRHTAAGRDGRPVELCRNAVPHEGPLVLTGPEGEDGAGVYRPMPGMALTMFDVPILMQVQGENVLYFNIRDKGIVTVTGCGHPGVLTLLSFGRESFTTDRLYGCYGGLHLSVFEHWDPKFDAIIEEVKGYGLEKMGCNHCTGWLWAEQAERAGLPIVKGTDRYKTYPKRSAAAKDSHAFLMNGDCITF